jgi:hypothetical protein
MRSQFTQLESINRRIGLFRLINLRFRPIATFHRQRITHITIAFITAPPIITASTARRKDVNTAMMPNVRIIDVGIRDVARCDHYIIVWILGIVDVIFGLFEFRWGDDLYFVVGIVVGGFDFGTFVR